MMSGEAFLDLARQRRSVRRFRDAPVPEGLLRELVEAATWAPSAGARQDWEFLVVVSPEKKQAMVTAVRDAWDALLERPDAGGTGEALGSYSENFSWFGEAPVVIAVTASRPEAFMRHLLADLAEPVAGRRVSAAMAAQNLMLAAHAHGLGSCCLTGPVAATSALAPLLDLGRRRELVCLIALGFPAETPPAPPRKEVDEVMRFLS